MKMKVLIIMLLSLLLLTNGASLNIYSRHHLQPASHDLADGPEHWFGFPAIPRKLMVNLKVDQGFEDKDSVPYNKQKEVVSGELHDIGGEEGTTTTSKESRLFTMDYSPVRRRRPVHNKSLPTTTTSP